jgi:hypothetical protein
MRSKVAIQVRKAQVEHRDDDVSVGGPIPARDPLRRRLLLRT